jgi:hypothetical protein
MGPEAEDNGWVTEEARRTVGVEFNWYKLKQDEKFTQEGAS